MSGYICLLTGDVLESIGVAPECANCTDAAWWYRDEQPIVNADGVKFCSVECADEYDTRVEAERAWRASDWCPECGFDNHEHQEWCHSIAATPRPGEQPVAGSHLTPSGSPDPATRNESGGT